jgi:hypothetical protein
MIVAPSPIRLLLTALVAVKFTIVSVVFTEINTVGAVFAIIPLVVIAMIAIVVTNVIAIVLDDNFLSRASRNRKRSRECGAKKNEAQMFLRQIHAKPPSFANFLIKVLAWAKYARNSGVRLCDKGHTENCPRIAEIGVRMELPG